MTKSYKTKNPTNAEIIAVLTPLVKDVQDLKQWKRDSEIAKAAVAEYVQSEPKTKPQQGSEQWLNRELVKTLIYALGIIAALVALVKGTKP